ARRKWRNNAGAGFPPLGPFSPAHMQRPGWRRGGLWDKMALMTRAAVSNRPAAFDAPASNQDDPVTCTAMSDILNRIGDKWSVQIVGRLSHGTMRFSELRRAIE